MPDVGSSRKTDRPKRQGRGSRKPGESGRGVFQGWRVSRAKCCQGLGQDEACKAHRI